MGLERAAACLQGVPTVFGTDIFRPIVAAVAEQLGVAYDADDPDGVRIRRMADHARALTFCIHENVQPVEREAGLRHPPPAPPGRARRLPDGPARAVPVPGRARSWPRSWARPYPELQGERPANPDRDPRGGGAVPQEPGERPEAAQRHLPQDQGRRLRHDRRRRGVRPPLDLRHPGRGHREPRGRPEPAGRPGRASRRPRSEFAGISRGTTEAAAVFATGPLDALKQSYHHGSEFLGYQTTAADATGHRHRRAEPPRRLGHGRRTAGPPIVARPRPDPVLRRERRPGRRHGRRSGASGSCSRSRHEEGQRLHAPHRPGDRGDRQRRRRGRAPRSTPTAATAIRRAHSATHVLHHALHTHLGKHAQQAGSKVEPDRLRFDFANPEAVGRDRLSAIEETVNDRVLEGEPDRAGPTMPIAEARTLGAMALFGEKYPEVVRVVADGRLLARALRRDAPGQRRPGRPRSRSIGEESVSAGTRRITALTGKAALDLVRQEEETLAEVASALKVPAAAWSASGLRRLARGGQVAQEAGRARGRPTPTPKTSPDDLLAAATAVGEHGS